MPPNPDQFTKLAQRIFDRLRVDGHIMDDDRVEIVQSIKDTLIANETELRETIWDAWCDLGVQPT